MLIKGVFYKKRLKILKQNQSSYVCLLFLDRKGQKKCVFLAKIRTFSKINECTMEFRYLFKAIF